jgi:Tol biopolymer transport system component
MRTSAAVALLAASVLLGHAPPADGQGFTERVSVDSSGAAANDDSFDASPSLSADGTVVAFVSAASNLVASDANGQADVFVHDRTTGVTERVSVSSSGAEADSWSAWTALSADGRFVVFASNADNLVAGDTNQLTDVFVRDRVQGTTERVSLDSSGKQGDRASPKALAISDDGRFVLFDSLATNFVGGDTNGERDVFVHDRTTGATECISVDASGKPGNQRSRGGTLSSDGRLVSFQSQASNLVTGDTNGSTDVFVRDRSAGLTVRVSVDSNGAQVSGASGANASAISADGSTVVFDSVATTLVHGDTNGSSDVFVHDLATGATERVSVDSAGVEGDYSSGLYSSAISADGRVVVFVSDADNLVARDLNQTTDVFVRDRSAGTTAAQSLDSLGYLGDGRSGTSGTAVSADGHVSAYGSFADDLDPHDANGFTDVFVREECVIDAAWTNYGAGFAGTLGVPAFSALSNPQFGTTLTLDLSNSAGFFTVGLLCVGLQRTSIHSGWGGDLLVLPAFTQVVGIPAGGTSYVGDVAADGSLCGAIVDLQALEADPGAAKGVSFSAGLELTIGR